MKNIVAWIKGNIAIVVCLALILIILPTAFIFSSSWNKKIKTAQEKAASDKLSQVNATKVTYTIPSFEPGVEAVSLARVPSDSITTWFKTEREKLKGQADAVVKRAEDFNRGVGEEAKSVGRVPHVAFIPDLFPSTSATAERQLKGQLGEEKFNATPEEERKKKIAEMAKALDETLTFDMESRLLGKRGYPNPYEQLLTDMHAGPAADPVSVLEAVNSLRQREIQQKTGRQLTPEEQAALGKQMSEQRIAEYLGHAGSVSVFATMDSFPKNAAQQSIPRDKIPPDRLKPVELFLYQWDYWVLQDIAAVVRFANTAPDGTHLPIPSSLIKRVESISLFTPEVLSPRMDDSGSLVSSAEPVPSETPGLLPRDLQASFTGHNSGKWNQLYDTRKFEITMVVASSRVQDVINDFARVNFMTVTAMEISEVDVWADIRDGYAYGSDHVVRVKFTVDSLWLRSWLKDFMPPGVKAAYGVAEEPPKG